MTNDAAEHAPHPVLADHFMALLHPQLELYGIDATNEAFDQVDDLVQIVRRDIGVPLVTLQGVMRGRGSEDAYSAVGAITSILRNTVGVMPELPA